MDFKEIVEPLKLKNVHLARALNVSDSHIADLKSGRRKLTLKVAARLEVLTERRDIVSALAAEQVSQ